jgi:acetoacetyl-CoA reductase/3-oxoacyl-[acyl-carrier protein] reductase
MMGMFDGQKVVVTGAAGGIGGAIARRFAQLGGEVIAVDLQIADLEALKATMTEGAAPELVTLDCTDRDAVAAEFARIQRDHARVDVLVNNIGRSGRERAREFADSDPDLWDIVIDTSLRTTMNCTRQVLDGMRQRRFGKIVNISSDAAIYGGEKLAEYAAAKAGLIGFTRSVAREMAPFGVNVNVVCPGITRTRAVVEVPEDVIKAGLKTTPLGMMCEPEDIACAVTFLASADARCIVGQSLLVNGGRVMQ